MQAKSPQLTDQQLADLQGWAASHSEIVEVWVIGSRARGRAHGGSDLDLTLELDPGDQYSDEDSVLISNRAAWKAELTERLGLLVKDIHGENAQADVCYGQGRRTGISVYRRAGD
jgi:predicted nucleotidyltransferase